MNVRLLTENSKIVGQLHKLRSFLLIAFSRHCFQMRHHPTLAIVDRFESVLEHTNEVFGNKKNDPKSFAKAQSMNLIIITLHTIKSLSFYSYVFTCTCVPLSGDMSPSTQYNLMLWFFVHKATLYLLCESSLCPVTQILHKSHLLACPTPWLTLRHCQCNHSLKQLLKKNPQEQNTCVFWQTNNVSAKIVLFNDYMWLASSP